MHRATPHVTSASPCSQVHIPPESPSPISGRHTQNEYITRSELEARCNAFLDYIRSLAETIHGFADTIIEKYPPFDFPPDLLVMSGKSNEHLSYRPHFHPIQDPNSDSGSYASNELRSGSNCDALHFTSISSLSPAPLAVSDSEGLAFKPRNSTTPQAGHVNMIAADLGNHILPAMPELSMLPAYTLEQRLLNLDQGRESPQTDDDITSISSSSQIGNSPGSSSPNSPCLVADRYITVGELKNLFKAVLKDRFVSNSEGATYGPKQPKVDGGNKAPASKLEYKAVDEMYVFCLLCCQPLLTHVYSWNEKVCKYGIVDSPPAPDVSELDEYIFIVRTRIGKGGSNISNTTN
jgi:hypothetical protein